MIDIHCPATGSRRWRQPQRTRKSSGWRSRRSTLV
jgi:hypothetical protein